MTKSKTTKITVRAASVTLTDFHIKRSEGAGVGEKVSRHEASAGEGVQR